jgi:hypothetical protein
MCLTLGNRERARQRPSVTQMACGPGSRALAEKPRVELSMQNPVTQHCGGRLELGTVNARGWLTLLGPSVPTLMGPSDMAAMYMHYDFCELWNRSVVMLQGIQITGSVQC